MVILKMELNITGPLADSECRYSAHISAYSFHSYFYWVILCFVMCFPPSSKCVPSYFIMELLELFYCDLCLGYGYFQQKPTSQFFFSSQGFGNSYVPYHSYKCRSHNNIRQMRKRVYLFIEFQNQ